MEHEQKSSAIQSQLETVFIQDSEHALSYFDNKDATPQATIDAGSPLTLTHCETASEPQNLKQPSTK